MTKQQYNVVEKKKLQTDIERDSRIIGHNKDSKKSTSHIT